MSENMKNTVLVVDDEPANIFFLEGLLTEEGYDVITANNGEECIELLDSTKPDIILLDIMMPDMTGNEVLDILMKNNSTKDIPVIMVTAKTDSMDVKTSLDQGAVEYIKKPVDSVELLARVKTVLRLKEKEDSLRQMIETKDEFIRMVSHDLRTPFASISGFAEMLVTDIETDKKINEESMDYLKYIIDTSQFMIDYFNKLLDWSNTESSKIKLKKEQIPFRKIANSAKIIFLNKLKMKNIHMDIEECGDMNLEIDETYFMQVINNLVSNAIKFTPENGQIILACRKENDHTDFLVQDSGVGLTNVSRDELFESTFHKSTRGTKGEKGSGVGLRICKRIVDAHGFDIDFESEDGKGTKFYIRMPSS